MKRTIITTIKRMLSFSLMLTMIMTTYSINAYASETVDSEEVFAENDCIVTYDVATGEITYEYNSSELEDDGTGIIKQENESPAITRMSTEEGWKAVSDPLESPYRNVCNVEATFPDGYTETGSGTLVYFNVLLTAGHCVYQSEHNGWATTVRVSPARDGFNNDSLGVAYTTQYSVPSNYVNNSWLHADEDWAVCNLNRSYSTWQYFGRYYEPSKQVGTSVTLMGYPKIGGNSYYMYTSAGTVISATDTVLHLTCVGGDGFSGGPIIDKNSGVLVGLHKGTHESGNYTVAIRMNERLYNVLRDRINEMQGNS